MAAVQHRTTSTSKTGSSKLKYCREGDGGSWQRSESRRLQVAAHRHADDVHASSPPSRSFLLLLLNWHIKTQQSRQQFVDSRGRKAKPRVALPQRHTATTGACTGEATHERTVGWGDGEAVWRTDSFVTPVVAFRLRHNVAAALLFSHSVIFFPCDFVELRRAIFAVRFSARSRVLVGATYQHHGGRSGVVHGAQIACSWWIRSGLLELFIAVLVFFVC